MYIFTYLFIYLSICMYYRLHVSRNPNFVYINAWFLPYQWVMYSVTWILCYLSLHLNNNTTETFSEVSSTTMRFVLEVDTIFYFP